MVEVACNLLVGDILNDSIEVVAVLVLQWDDGTNLYVLSIKLAIDCKDLLVEIEYALVVVEAISLLWLQLKVELLALFKIYHLLFECWQCYAHAADEDERTLVCCTLDEHFFTVITFSYIVECIRHYDKFVLVV